MVEKLFNKLSSRALSIIYVINKTFIIGAVASLVLCLSFAFANRLINTGHICGISLIIFMVCAAWIFLEAVVLTVLFLINAVKRDGILKLLKGFAITYIPFVLLVASARYAIKRSVNWDVIEDCILPIWGMFLWREACRFKKDSETWGDKKGNL
jgi:hypothetical protein